MIERLRIFIAGCFYYSGLLKFALRQIQRSKPQLIILAYHNMSGGDLRRQMLYLRRHYRILPIKEAIEELYMPAKKQGRNGRIPVVLTFDDGYRDNYTYGFALAQELKIPITIFLAPGYIDSGRSFWWREGQLLAKHTTMGKVRLEGNTFDLSKRDGRAKLENSIISRLLSASSVVEREAYLQSVRTELNVPPALSVDEEPFLPLTWAQVKEMDASGWVTFGAHTMNHPILANLTDPEEIQYEVSKCRLVLEEHLEHPVEIFAYPLGKPEHIGKEGLQAVKAAGYRWALTSIEKANTGCTDPYLLHRFPRNVNRHWLVMASELVGLLRIISRLKKKLKRLNLNSPISLTKKMRAKLKLDVKHKSEFASEVAQGERFEFGKNWNYFLRVLNEERIQFAEQSLLEMLGLNDLRGKQFLDIGSGSGLASLAARRLGATVYSFDYDPLAVACGDELKRRYFPEDYGWTIEEGSVLDTSYLTALGQFDIVYSWGVLHHTGAMWQSLENVAQVIAPGGLLFIAIYNDQEELSRYWKTIKKAYNRVPERFRFFILLPVFLRLWGARVIHDFLRLKSPLYTWRNYSRVKRGMSPWRDVVDWVGGYPFEVARPEAILAFYRKKGFSLVKLKTTNGLGCNEYVFLKKSSTQLDQ